MLVRDDSGVTPFEIVKIIKNIMGLRVGRPSRRIRLGPPELAREGCGILGGQGGIYYRRERSIIVERRVGGRRERERINRRERVREGDRGRDRGREWEVRGEGGVEGEKGGGGEKIGYNNNGTW